LETFFNNNLFVFDNCSSNLIDEPNAYQTKLGNGESFQFALDLALRYSDDHCVYFVEDDYLHRPEAHKILLEGLEAFDGFVTLYDHPDKYDVRKINHLVQVRNGMAGEVTSLYKTNSCHWKITNSTTMTFAARVGHIRLAQSIMRKHAVGRPTDFAMWLEIKKELDMNVYSSIPGYSSHCEAGYESPLTDWRKVL
jgi:glycosyltransferase involved in cell wall biosynthesis